MFSLLFPREPRGYVIFETLSRIWRLSVFLFFVFLFFCILPHQFLFQSNNFSMSPQLLPHILPQILPQTTSTNHYHNWGVNIYYHTNLCANPTIFQFYHILPQILPQTTTTISTDPPQRFMYLRETHTNVLIGLQRFYCIQLDSLGRK